MSYYEYNRDTNRQNIVCMPPHNISYEEHFHKGVEILLCVDKSIDIKIGKDFYTANEGESVFIQSGESHKITDNGENVFMLIPIRYLSTYFQFGNTALPVTPVIDKEHSKFLFDTIMPIVDKISKMTELSKFGLVYTLLGHIGSVLQFREENVNNLDFDILTNITKYIEEHFNEDISLEKLASKFNYSKTYLSGKLHNDLGIDIRKYINDIRLEHFVKHFNPELPLEAQLYSYGFGSKRTFYRTFEEKFGVTPVKYFDKILTKK